MVSSVLFFIFLILDFVSLGWNHVGQPCNSIVRICLASNSYCDHQNICRCKPEYPVNVSLHSCKKGRVHNERCDFSEECFYRDPNSYCTQSYGSICVCHSGFKYNENEKICQKVEMGIPKSSNVVFPTVIGVSLAVASILCFFLVAWHVCKRQNVSPRSSHYLPTNVDFQPTIPSAPSLDETLPTYDTALSLKISEDCEPPPSYEDVIELERASKV